MSHGRRTKNYGLLHITSAVRRIGLATLAREALYRTVNTLCESWFGVETAGKVHLASFGIHNDEWHEYAPVGYWAIASALRRVPLRFRDIGFLDIGSGKGRPLVVASVLGCQRIVGIDVVPAFNLIARQNLARVGAHRATAIDTDAAAFKIPADINVLYIANSFVGETLEALIRNIHASHDASPRAMYLICFNARNFELHLAQHQHPRFRLIDRALHYPGFSCNTYEVT